MSDEIAKALRPFADYAEYVAREHPGWDHDQFTIDVEQPRLPTMKEFRAARAALTAYEKAGVSPAEGMLGELVAKLDALYAKADIKNQADDHLAQVRAIMHHCREAFALDGRISFDSVGYRIAALTESVDPGEAGFSQHVFKFGTTIDYDGGGPGKIRNTGQDSLTLRAESHRMDVALVRTDASWPTPNPRGAVKQIVVG